ncbi:MAG: aldo/keto reductase [Desulfobacterales bacterium]|uniref:Aldo/keto reductase n=1 Tax=Candidatus Desulfatibia vada TaxID=2841696 RepID=A0A8J6P9D9_9BACT|nr:aldo/keto reductase [Candidatus Desulfatibia vada]
MKRIAIGKTGLKVNRLGFGGIPIARVDESQAVETVLHAVESGVDFIDTARNYKTSERRIGMALQQTDKRVVLASRSQGRTADDIRADLETSLKELQKDYLDLYRCHFVRDDQVYQEIIAPGGALEGLMQAKQEGMIGHIGLTNHSLDLLERVVDEGLFETIMVCYSFLEPKAKESIIPKALAKNIGVIAMKSFSGGVIDDPQLALKYVLSQPDIIIIPGVETKELFDQNRKVFQGSYSLSPAEKLKIETIRNRYGKSFCRRCDYCQPCREEVPIQLVLGVRSALKRFGKSFLQEGWPREAIDKARNCSECGDRSRPGHTPPRNRDLLKTFGLIMLQLNPCNGFRVGSKQHLEYFVLLLLPQVFGFQESEVMGPAPFLAGARFYFCGLCCQK